MRPKVSTIHLFKVEGIDGEEIDFSAFKGKKIMVVNVASECGYTPQYQQLQELQKEFNDKLVIIGFPCNDFGGQEPGSAEEIQAFCSLNYGLTFPLTQKITIKGESVHPIYNWLLHKSNNQVMDTEVTWNFCKYILDEEGQLVNFFPSATSPFDDAILEWVQN